MAGLYLNIGDDFGGIGSYSLSGSGLLTAETEYVGYAGMGNFTQSGGTNDIFGGLELGRVRRQRNL